MPWGLERPTNPQRAARAILVGTALISLLVSTGCLHRHRPAPAAQGLPPPITVPATRQPGAAPIPAHIVQGEEGIASWYGHPYHGRPTASGETYNMYDMTAAHRTLPFGTHVRVHDLQNGRETEVRINDRGPFVEGRIIDLSYAAAQAIGMPGTARVQLEILGLAPTTEAGIFAVQVGAFQDRNNAERFKTRLAPYGPVTIQTFDRGDAVFYRVRVGQESSEDAARDLGRKLRQAGLASETFVVRVN